MTMPVYGYTIFLRQTTAERNGKERSLSEAFRGKCRGYLPTPSWRRKVIIGHQFVNPD